MFGYGRILAQLPDRELERLIWRVTGRSAPLIAAVRTYLGAFGYPDVAGQVRFALVQQLVKTHPVGRLLDIGCGNGIYTLTFSARFQARSVGVDLRGERLPLARQAARSLHIRASFGQARATQLPFPDGAFTHVLLIEVLEHIREDQLALEEIRRVLQPGGNLILTVPREDPFPHDGDHDYGHAHEGAHVRDGYEPEELVGLVERAGFSVVRWIPYYRWFTKWVVRYQQQVYSQNAVATNILMYPLLRVASGLDWLASLRKQAWHRGNVLIARC